MNARVPGCEQQNPTDLMQSRHGCPTAVMLLLLFKDVWVELMHESVMFVVCNICFRLTIRFSDGIKIFKWNIGTGTCCSKQMNYDKAILSLAFLVDRLLCPRLIFKQSGYHQFHGKI